MFSIYLNCNIVYFHAEARNSIENAANSEQAADVDLAGDTTNDMNIILPPLVQLSQGVYKEGNKGKDPKADNQLNRSSSVT